MCPRLCRGVLYVRTRRPSGEEDLPPVLKCAQGRSTGDRDQAGDGLLAAPARSCAETLDSCADQSEKMTPALIATTDRRFAVRSRENAEERRWKAPRGDDRTARGQGRRRASVWVCDRGSRHLLGAGTSAHLAGDAQADDIGRTA